MAASTTREALLEQGALLFARHGVAGVTAKQLHDAIGARNESAVHYHFGGCEGLVAEIVRLHLDAVEERRAKLVEAMVADGTTGDLRAIVHALAAPMADDLATPVGRAHLRIVAELSHPALAYTPAFAVRPAEASPSGARVVHWLADALDEACPRLPRRIRAERLAALRGQLIALFGLRAQLLDDDPSQCTPARTTLFVENLLDMLVAGLTVPPSPAAAKAARARRR
jgi:AcrR family transcriptional regulator